MTREEFAGVFLGYVVKKIPSWLPEESTEEQFLDIIQKRMAEHNKDIKDVLGVIENHMRRHDGEET